MSNLIDVTARRRRHPPDQAARTASAPPARPTATTSASRRARRKPRRMTTGRTARKDKTMYRYDEFDQDFVNARVAEFTRPGGPPAGRRDHRRPVPAAAADERRLSAAARLHAARRHPLRHAELEAAADARPHRPQIRQGLWPFHDAPEHPVQLAGAVRRAGDPGRPGQRRDARDPDLRQLHPQRHRRPFRRRGRRRGRRPAALCRDPAAVVVGASRSSPTCRASSRSR